MTVLACSTNPPKRHRNIAFVVIGRNEGERLRRCLQSVLPQACEVLYVDSGSTDESVAMARGLGVHVVELDMSCTFTAARARNEGFRCLRTLAPGIELVHFLDGDCEIVQGWLEAALALMTQQADVAAVGGRNCERFPDHSIYNLLYGLEWNRAEPGETRYCGGNALMRVAAIAEVGGFRENLIAGEEPEMCVRLRAKGWRIWRLDADMAWHDAAMLHFSQWWKRSMRTGYAFAEGAHIHGAPPERHFVQETNSGWGWGLMLPLLLAIAAYASGPMMLWGAAIYPLQMLRLYWPRRALPRAGALYAVFTVLSKFPQALGQLKCVSNRLSGRRAQLIEYK